MRFSTAVNVLFLGVATVVSALPIAQSISSLELESRDDYDVLPDMFERDFDEPTLYRRTKYDVALHRSKMGTEKEHWSMQFHPQTSHATATWHNVDALSAKTHNGVLVTDHQIKGGHEKVIDGVTHPGGYNANLQTGPGRHHMVLGSFDNAKDAKKAAESLKGIHCTKPYPEHNCVDWTKHAVEKLHADGHINADAKNRFTAHYDAHQAAVRTTTGTAANKEKAHK